MYGLGVPGGLAEISTRTARVAHEDMLSTDDVVAALGELLTGSTRIQKVEVVRKAIAT